MAFFELDADHQELSGLIAVAESTLRAHNVAGRAVIEDNIIALELWVYVEPRACMLWFDNTQALQCGLYMNATAVASLAPVDVAELPALVECWFVERVDVGGLCERFPDAQCVLDAQLIERGELAAWQWAELRRRNREAGSIIASLLAILAMPASSLRMRRSLVGDALAALATWGGGIMEMSQSAVDYGR